MRVLVDCDGVLAGLVPHAVSAYNKLRPSPVLRAGSLRHYDLRDAPPGFRAFFYSQVDNPDFIAELPPLPSARAGLRELCKLADVTVLTRVKTCVADARVAWLERNFPWLNRGQIVVSMRPKASFPGEAILDDHHDNLGGDRVLRMLRSRSYNLNRNRADWVRISSWDQVHYLVNRGKVEPWLVFAR